MTLCARIWIYLTRHLDGFFHIQNDCVHLKKNNEDSAMAVDFGDQGSLYIYDFLYLSCSSTLYHNLGIYDESRYLYLHLDYQEWSDKIFPV
jgi:hypothetical protein